MTIKKYTDKMPNSNKTQVLPAYLCACLISIKNHRLSKGYAAKPPPYVFCHNNKFACEMYP